MNKKKLILVLLIGFTLMNCGFKKPIKLDYCKMLEEDQSYVNTDKSNMEKHRADANLRDAIFYKNFKSIIELTIEEEFPDVDTKKDSCLNMAVFLTMVHTAQSNPTLFFSDEIIALFKEEMKNGSLDKEMLINWIVMGYLSNETDEKIKLNIDAAIKKLDIDREKIFEGIKKNEDGSRTINLQ